MSRYSVAGYGSLTKEPPLSTLDATISAITPGMPYSHLLNLARLSSEMHSDAPGLVRARFLLVDDNDAFVYDKFLSLVSSEGIDAAVVRKVMYLVWALRDDRLRQFILEVVANTNGQWNVDDLTNKDKAAFLETWLADSSAKKARSNIEYFLVETGLYHLTDASVHLELEDNWLETAVRIAAQHELDPAIRREMVQTPIEFITSRHWHGLANATLEQLGKIEVDAEVEDDPFIDGSIAVEPSPAKSTGKAWKRREPSASGRTSTTAQIDLVAKERANKAHYLLEKLTANAVEGKGYGPECNKNIDLFFNVGSTTVVAEMKSCHQGNLHSQVRKGVSQLYEYQYVYRDEFSDENELLLVIETEPAPSKLWLVDYLESIGITLAWKNASGDRLLTSSKIPDALDGIVFASD